MVKVQLMITDEAMQFRLPEGKKLRNNFFIKTSDLQPMKVNMHQFEHWMRTIDKVTEEQIKVHNLALQRLFHMVRVVDESNLGSDGVDFRSVLVELHRSELMLTMRILPVFDLNWGPAACMQKGLTKLAEYGVFLSSSRGDDVCEKIIGKLQILHLRKWGADANKTKNERNDAKQALDGAALDNYPPPQVCLDWLKDMLCELRYLHVQKHEDKIDFGPNEHRAANKCIAVIVHLSTYQGRKSEWSAMKREQTLKELEA